jgi:hypothetical protein
MQLLSMLWWWLTGMDKVNRGVHARWTKLRAMKGEREDLDREIKGWSTDRRLLMLGHDDKQEYNTTTNFVFEKPIF